MEDQPHFYDAIHAEKGTLDFDKVEKEVVQRTQSLIEDNDKEDSEASRILCMESGKPIQQAISEASPMSGYSWSNFHVAMANVKTHRGLTLPNVTEDSNNKRILHIFEPLGVVANISTFSYPLEIPKWRSFVSGRGVRTSWPMARFRFFVNIFHRRLFSGRSIWHRFVTLFGVFAPFHRAALKKPVYTTIRYAFHACIFIVSIGFSGHVYLWEESRFECYWTPLPDEWADRLTIFVVFVCAFFIGLHVISKKTGSTPKFRILHSSSSPGCLLCRGIFLLTVT